MVKAIQIMESDYATKERVQRESNITSLAGHIKSKLKFSCQCRVEKWPAESNILVDGEDSRISDVSAVDLCDMLEASGYLVRYGVIPESYPIYVAKAE